MLTLAAMANSERGRKRGWRDMYAIIANVRSELVNLSLGSGASPNGCCLGASGGTLVAWLTHRHRHRLQKTITDAHSHLVVPETVASARINPLRLCRVCSTETLRLGFVVIKQANRDQSRASWWRTHRSLLAWPFLA